MDHTKRDQWGNFTCYACKEGTNGWAAKVPLFMVEKVELGTPDSTVLICEGCSIRIREFLELDRAKKLIAKGGSI